MVLINLQLYERQQPLVINIVIINIYEIQHQIQPMYGKKPLQLQIAEHLPGRMQLITCILLGRQLFDLVQKY
jgi:hypothetical protein